MAQITVTKNGPHGEQEEIVLWRERVNPADLHSEHFRAQLLERLDWAVSDAAETETPATG